jgi:hypothetical protein
MSFSAAQAAPVLTLARRFTSRHHRANFFCNRFTGYAGACLARVLILAFCAGLFACTAASAAILIESRVGFHGVFQLGRPFPLEIELTNTGRPAEGTLDIQVWKGGATKGGTPYPVKYRRELFLGAQSRKTLQFTVDPDFVSRPMSIVFIGSNTKAVREIDLRRHFSPAPLLLLLSENSTLPLSIAGSLQNRLVSVALAELATDPRALLGVSHLIIYDQSLRDLSRAQLAAIDAWLSAGGSMMILGSLNHALYQEPALGRFLPVRVVGAKRITYTPNGAKGARPVSITDAWVQLSTPTHGKVLAEAQGVPVIVEATRGRGRILYLALDVGRPPLAQWEGLPKLMQNLLGSSALDDPAPRSEWNDGIFTQLVTSPTFVARYVPSASLLIGIVLYLAGIGIIALQWQRKRQSPRALAGIFFGFVAAATLAGYFQFHRGGNIPDAVLLSSTVLESSADGFVEAQANLALFSTQVRQYKLQLERGWMDLTPVSVRAKESQEAAVVHQDGGGSSRYQLPLREWDYRLFRVRFVDRFPMRAEFEVQGDKLLMKVDNQSAKDLIDCWLLLPGQRFALGEIPRGARWSKTFPLAGAKALEEAGSGRPDGVSLREISFAEKTRDILFHSSYFPRDQAAGWSGGLFFGWVKNPEPRVRSDAPNVQAQDYALYRVLVPLAQGEDE